MITVKDTMLSFISIPLMLKPSKLKSFIIFVCFLTDNVVNCDLYILLKSALARGSYEIRVQDLLCRFGSLKLRSSHLDFRILKPCLREITDKTDLVVTHEIQRTSRRKAEVVAFTILRKGNLPSGKRLYNTAGPIVIPGMCEDKKIQLYLEGLYRSYHERQTEAANSFPFAKFQHM